MGNQRRGKYQLFNRQWHYASTCSQPENYPKAGLDDEKKKSLPPSRNRTLIPYTDRLFKHYSPRSEKNCCENSSLVLVAIVIAFASAVTTIITGTVSYLNNKHLALHYEMKSR
jgi:hypothetical protein